MVSLIELVENLKVFTKVWTVVLVLMTKKVTLKKIGGINQITTTQGNFLTKMGIKQRAEIISKNLTFLKKADLYYRLKRLVDKEQMGKLFKVMLIKNYENTFNLGF